MKETELPPVDIVDEAPIGDPAKALEQASAAGDLSSGGADTPLPGGESDPASSSATPEPEKRGPGRPKGSSSGKFTAAPRPRGDATLTAKDLDKLRKDEIAALLVQAGREKKALEEKLEDARVKAIIHDAAKGEVIDADEGFGI